MPLPLPHDLFSREQARGLADMVLPGPTVMEVSALCQPLSTWQVDMWELLSGGGVRQCSPLSARELPAIPWSSGRFHLLNIAQRK